MSRLVRPGLPWDTLALAWQPAQRRREAASGQLYPWWSEATRFASRSPRHSDWHGSTPPSPPGGGRVFSFFPAAHIFCSDKHSSEQCGRVCRPSQRRIRKSLTWSKNIVKKEQTAQSGNDLVNGSAGGGPERARERRREGVSSWDYTLSVFLVKDQRSPSCLSSSWKVVKESAL